MITAAQVAASNKAYHVFETMVDARCVRDEGGFTLHWLVVAFHSIRAIGYIQFKEYVNHFLEKAVRCPQPPWSTDARGVYPTSSLGIGYGGVTVGVKAIIFKGASLLCIALYFTHPKLDGEKKKGSNILPIPPGETGT